MILTILGFLSVIAAVLTGLFFVALGGKDKNVIPYLLFAILVLSLDTYLLIENLKVLGYVN